MSNKVEYKGKIYEIGKMYIINGKLKELSGIVLSAGFHPFVAMVNGSSYQYATCVTVTVPMEQQHLFGTIEDAPFEPEVGKLYEFRKYTAGKWHLCTLGVIDPDKPLKYISTDGEEWAKCRPVPKNHRAEYGE